MGDGFERRGCYKGGLVAGVVIFGGAIAAGSMAFAAIGAGGAIAAVGEWMHMRKSEFPIDPGGIGRPALNYWQLARVESRAGDVVLWFGLALGVVGILAIAKQLLFT